MLLNLNIISYENNYLVNRKKREALRRNASNVTSASVQKLHSRE